MAHDKALAVDLNSDLGEGFGAYRVGTDAEMLKLVSSANIACGFHAGDPGVMRETVALAVGSGARLGAHPGFPDLMGFGRRDLGATAQEFEDYVIYQVGALAGFAAAAGHRLQHVKCHGAMYNMAARDEKLARALARGVRKADPSLVFVALSGSILYRAGLDEGLVTAAEAFGDRGYLDNGQLVPRSHPRALITDPEEVAARVATMVGEGYVLSIDGHQVPVQADTICLHGDNPAAVNIAARLRDALSAQGIQVRAMAELPLAGRSAR